MEENSSKEVEDGKPSHQHIDRPTHVLPGHSKVLERHGHEGALVPFPSDNPQGESDMVKCYVLWLSLHSQILTTGPHGESMFCSSSFLSSEFFFSSSFNNKFVDAVMLIAFFLTVP